MFLGTAHAQQAPGIVVDGNAVVTGFSGVQLPPLIAPGVDPAGRITIDLNGPSLRVIDLQAPGAAPQAQVLTGAKPFTATAGQVGQVFGIALDNASPPNIYVAATSVYGLPIVVPDADGDGLPDRAEQGTANASFMAGLFGPREAGGGPGSIWRIDGMTGAVSLFANVTLDGAPNGGAALGGLAFDPASNALLVADRETGMIHSFDLNGSERGRYDHGTQGRSAGGLPPVPFDPNSRLVITRPPFQPANPDSWGYAPPRRRVFGLAVREGRLYYAVAEGLQIWSVALTPDGAFGTDARMEFSVPPGQSASEMSKIAFDDQGRMLVAERIAPTGAFNFVSLTEEGGGRVLRYVQMPSATGPTWQPEEYAIGFAAQSRGNGGVSVGYGVDANGRLDRNSCSGFVWSTGEQLRVAPDAALAAQLAQGGPVNVNGVQGNAIDLVRPANTPPLQSYFVDYDDRFEDANARGQMGDVVVFRQCAPGAIAGLPPAPPPGGVPPAPPPGEPGPPGPEMVPPLEPLPAGIWPGPWGPWPFGPWPDGGPPPPPPVCPPGTHLEQGGPTNGPRQCCPVVGGVSMVPGPGGGCVSKCANGSLVPKDNLTCELGFQPGHNPGGGFTYPILGAAGLPMICWNGQPPTKVNPAVPGNLAANNKCPKPPIGQCQAGFQLVYATAANPVQPDWLWSNATCVQTPAQAGCAPGQQVGANGTCQNLCPAGQVAFPVNRCCANGTAPNALGQCNPGIIVSPDWAIGFAAGGTFWCIPGVNCSYFEFTITGQKRFGRGSLVQRITLPPGAAMEGRIIRGSRYCPASAWSCSKSGNVLTCSAEHCGLAPGDQVVLRIEGNVAPELREPPAEPTERTACGVLEWQSMAGLGAATIEQVRDVGKATPPPAQPTEGVGTDRFSRISAKQVCWTIRIPARQRTPEACAPGYLPTADNQCCLASQMTVRGQCCPVGQRPDPRGQTCVRITPPTFTPPIFTPPVTTTPCGPESVRLPSGECCPRSQMTVAGQCCPAGTRPDARRRTCVRPERPEPPVVTPPPCPEGWTRIDGRCTPPSLRPCPRGWSRVDGRCVPPAAERPCPRGWSRVDGRCIPPSTERPCPPGWSKVRGRCIPPAAERPCPAGWSKVRGRCMPPAAQRPCPEGWRRVGTRCMPTRQPDTRRQQSGRQPDMTRPRPGRQPDMLRSRPGLPQQLR